MEIQCNVTSTVYVSTELHFEYLMYQYRVMLPVLCALVKSYVSSTIYTSSNVTFQAQHMSVQHYVLSTTCARTLHFKYYLCQCSITFQAQHMTELFYISRITYINIALRFKHYIHNCNLTILI